MYFPIDQIQDMIYEIRGQRVMLDSDLAKLYGVEVRVLNQSVRRNLRRFPEDFIFKLTKEEYKSLKSQFVTSKVGRGGKQKQPLVFTENGVAMLSGILSVEGFGSCICNPEKREEGVTEGKRLEFSFFVSTNLFSF